MKHQLPLNTNPAVTTLTRTRHEPEKDDGQSHRSDASRASIKEPDAASGVSLTPSPGLSPVAIGGSVFLAACGNGGDNSPLPLPSSEGKKAEAEATSPSLAPSPVAITAIEAARFLTQSAMGAQMDDIQSVRKLGYSGWVNEQMARPIGETYITWINANSPDNRSGRNAFDIQIWKRLLSNTDQLRQRMAFALSQIFVIDVQAMPGGWWPSELSGHFMDLLEKNAFGNFRVLLEDVSLSTAMGFYLTHKGSAAADRLGRVPDENYAREIMQLFTIGLVELNDDGSQKRTPGGALIDTYDNSDIQGLARVFTGWDHPAYILNSVSRLETATTPMKIYDSRRHEIGEKKFLDLTIGAGTSATESLRLALDHLFNHSNVPPFIGRQLIQRFVTSNPSAAYIGRVSAAFRNNGSGVRGDLGATLRAVLLDPEARNAPTGDGSEGKGKLREPILRFTAWARACRVTSFNGQWLRSTNDPATALAQGPGRAPSVFNFYRPGYTPPGTEMAQRGLVAPEFQITTESSVAGYLNFMQRAISSDNAFGNLNINYSDWEVLADDPAALVQQANLLLSGGGLSASAITIIQTAVAAMPIATPAQRRDRVQAAMLLTMAAPETLVSR
jgi:uncharacterized protein (DUF1800 family)